MDDLTPSSIRNCYEALVRSFATLQRLTVITVSSFTFHLTVS
jgi:hypothetical protein